LPDCKNFLIFSGAGNTACSPRKSCDEDAVVTARNHEIEGRGRMPLGNWLRQLPAQSRPGQIIRPGEYPRRSRKADRNRL